jgi:hypothetical protein
LQAEPVTLTDAEATDQPDLVAPTADFDRRPAEQNGGSARGYSPSIAVLGH